MRKFRKETNKFITTIAFTDEGLRVTDTYTKSNGNNKPFIKKAYNIEEDVKQLIRRGFTEDKL